MPILTVEGPETVLKIGGRRRSLLARIRRSLVERDRVLITDRNSGSSGGNRYERQTLAREVPEPGRVRGESFDGTLRP